jgi:hypothetical protein
MSQQRADIEITTASGGPLAVVEVKNVPQLTHVLAGDVRDALTEHLPRPVKYVLVLSQSKGFIWQKGDEQAGYGDPEVLDMRPVLREYLTEAELDQHIRGPGLELIFSHWLGDLSRGHVTPPGGAADHGPFHRFTSDMRQARVGLEAVA